MISVFTSMNIFNFY